MATAQAQLLADLAAVLADPNGPAEEVVIGTTSLRVVRDSPALVPNDDWGDNRLKVERMTLFGLRADLGFSPVPDMELAVAGIPWTVESCPPGDVFILQLMRYRS